jgi:hypothetical protein
VNADNAGHSGLTIEMIKWLQTSIRSV